MASRVDPKPTTTRERAHLTAAHHEICTALTVFRSNIELVRIRLSDASPDDRSIPIHMHLGEIDAAIERLRSIADVMKRWHDEAA
jgi:hypothetical protein